jgi:hypothetical protein
VGLEIWHASERLPAELLEALSQPERGEIIIERQSVRADPAYSLARG